MTCDGDAEETLDRISKKLQSIEGKLDRLACKIDYYAACMQARFDRLERTAATHLVVIVSALERSRRQA